MSTLTFKSPLPNETFQLTAHNQVTTDAAGLCTVPAGTDLARSLIAFGWTIIAAVPTVDPHVAGAVWNNGGTLAISAG
ncbi:hypothetical protein GGQ85_001672 [Nitrobacter vulgaris]|jgi:hypothetical protein|uniref:hypothetical protein n=1 Tax=Nitrobacter vulgaris TaxID=29421 RepID=UPI00285DE1B5|nr:hypothetical protein [Nitrobacter vulgaris]MDR6303973.1 hypothetical protein [Nitrobacter vulgaris]